MDGEYLHTATDEPVIHDRATVLKAWVTPAYQTLDIRETQNTADICVRNDGFSFSDC